MAEGAIASIQPVMCVVIPVTCITFGRRILVSGLPVAILTPGLQMPARQRVSGLDMVIEFSFGPQRFNMAGIAFPTQSTVVLIVLCMAIKTK